MPRSKASPEPLMNTAEAARYLNLSPVTLRCYRSGHAENGPPFVKINREVRYVPASLREWIAARERRPSRSGMTHAKARIVKQASR